MATTFPYNRNIPLSTDKPSADQPLMQTNTNSIQDLIKVDHIGFGLATGTSSDGYHTIIHQDPGTPNRTRSGSGATTANFPGAIVNFNQVFQALYTPDSTVTSADTQLFSLTGQGGLSQLTGNLASADGWCWVGGILLQWGTVTGLANAAHQTAAVTFKDRIPKAIPFPNNIFIVLGSLIPSSSTTTAIGTFSVSAFSQNTFTYVVNMSGNGAGNRYPGFYWMAIGN